MVFVTGGTGLVGSYLLKYLVESGEELSVLVRKNKHPSLKKCENPRYVFQVHPKATKPEIAQALEEIYKEKGIRVVSVNTITIKPKARRVRGRSGFKPGYKKAVVTLEKGDAIDNT